MSNWNTYQNSYQNAPNEVKELVDSEQIAELLDELEKTHSTNISRPPLLLLITDYLLGIIDKKALHNGVGANVSSETLHTDLIKKIETLGSTLQDSTSEVPSDLSVEIAEAEAALKAVPEIRTMAQDIEKTKQAQPENVYTSSQEALLKESARKLPDDESRWGNQT